MAAHPRLGAGAGLARLAGLPEALCAIANAASVLGPPAPPAPHVA
jgi:hypothetical protein